MIYQVGDDDPMRHAKKNVFCCPEQEGRFGCTLDVGHEHPQHVAGDGLIVRAVWPVR